MKMTWILEDHDKTYDLTPTHIEGRPAFDVTQHKSGSLYTDYPVNALVNEAMKVARSKYYWGMRYFDPKTGKVNRARSIKEYCDAFLYYVLTSIGPILPFPKSKRYDHLVFAKIEELTDDMLGVHATFRKVSRKYRRYANHSESAKLHKAMARSATGSNACKGSAATTPASVMSSRCGKVMMKTKKAPKISTVKISTSKSARINRTIKA